MPCRSASFLNLRRTVIKAQHSFVHCLKGKLVHLLATLVLIGSSGIANAGIIYEVNRTVGAGSVVGFMETDGTLGAITGANFID
jgi:hypothetical protein